MQIINLSKERKENKKDPSAVPSLFPASLLIQGAWHRLMLQGSDFGLRVLRSASVAHFDAQLVPS